jgi:hypothetical protein
MSATPLMSTRERAHLRRSASKIAIEVALSDIAFDQPQRGHRFGDLQVNIRGKPALTHANTKLSFRTCAALR